MSNLFNCVLDANSFSLLISSSPSLDYILLIHTLRIQKFCQEQIKLLLSEEMVHCRGDETKFLAIAPMCGVRIEYERAKDFGHLKLSPVKQTNLIIKLSQISNYCHFKSGCFTSRFLYIWNCRTVCYFIPHYHNF